MAHQQSSATHHRKKPWIHALLQREVTKPAPSITTTTTMSVEQSPNIFESHVTTVSAEHPSSVQFYKPDTRNDNLAASIEPMWETTTHFSPTIPPTTMTTDELFSHYKQPERPLMGPMYLIIEGHSKVKTYGQQDGIIGRTQPKIVPVASTVDPVIEHVVSKDEDGRTFEVKHLHTKQEEFTTLSSARLKANSGAATNSTSSSMDSLLSLLDTSFGDYLNNEEELVRQDENMEINSEK